MHSVYEKVAKYVASHGGDPDKEELYTYSIECFVCMIIPSLLIFLCGILLGSLPNTIVWCLCFLSFRKLVGGAHASTQWRCTIYSLLIAIIGIYVIPLLFIFVWTKILFMIVSLITFLLLAPCDHPNHPLASDKCRKLKMNSIILLLICFPLLTVDSFMHIQLSDMITSSIMITTISVIIGKIQNLLKRKQNI
ncbi:MAG TPA: accessory gene regulator B family protein [Lachnospiraceae bacterium]|nr:accessory gene regulator B family protein [Lachnospiraceae bacterium]